MFITKMPNLVYFYDIKTAIVFIIKMPTFVNLRSEHEIFPEQKKLKFTGIIQYSTMSTEPVLVPVHSDWHGQCPGRLTDVLKQHQG
jgi:hypothetical protein